MKIQWTLRLVAILAAIALVAALLTFGPSACTSYFSAKKQAEVSKGQAGAAIDSGAEAMNTVSDVEQNAAITRETTKEAQHEVESAPAGDSNDAADRAACRMRSYANSERCARLRAARPAVAGRPDPAR